MSKRQKLPDNIDRKEVDSEGAIIAEHPSLETLDAIRKACVYQPTKQTDIIVDYDTHWYCSPVCLGDGKIGDKTISQPWKYIKLSPFIVPRKLRGYGNYVQIFMTASSAHEAGHIIFTKPLWNDYQHWCEVVDSPICPMIVNLIEDSRINDWILNGIGGSIGLDWGTLAKWVGRAWLLGFETELHAMRKDLKNRMFGIPPGRFLVSAITMMGLYGKYGDNEKAFLRLAEEYFPRLSKKCWVDFAKGVKLIQEASQHHSWNGSLENDCQELYRIFARYILLDKDGKMGAEGSEGASGGVPQAKAQSGEGSGDNLKGPFKTIEEAENALKGEANA